MNTAVANYSGDQSMLDFTSQPADTIALLRSRVRNVYIQLVGCCFIACLFLRNARAVVHCLRACPSTAATWCIAAQAVLSAVYALVVLYGFVLPLQLTCRQTCLIGMLMFASITVCNNLILALKAYVAHQHHRPLLAAGVLLAFPGPLVMAVYIVGYSAITMDEKGGCVAHYPSHFPWVKLGLDLPVNMLFSIAFLRVVVRQYRTIGTRCWFVLSRDGILIMCAIVGTNILCALVVAFELVGKASEIFILLDLVVTSTLLVQHVKVMRSAMQEHSKAISSGRSREQRAAAGAKQRPAGIDSSILLHSHMDLDKLPLVTAYPDKLAP